MSYLAAFLTGVFAAMGVGGGMILIVYLTLLAGYTQLEAQGINLVCFIPIALTALIIHTKNRLVEWKKIIPAVICGAFLAIAGVYGANYIGSGLLRKIFGGFVLLVGIMELFSGKGEGAKKSNDKSTS